MARTGRRVKTGSYETRDGYIRVTAGPWRGKLLHRIIADVKWREKYGVPMPSDKEVHHNDRNRKHCCPAGYPDG